MEEAETDVLSSIVRLVQSDCGDDSRLTIITSSDSSRVHLLGSRLLELCDLRVELEAWNVDEVENFVRTSLTSAACSAELFPEGSVRRLLELTEGIPRRIQQLAQLSLVAATAQDLQEIDENTLDAVQRELTAASW